MDLVSDNIALPAITVSYSVADAYYPSLSGTQVVNLPSPSAGSEFQVNTFTMADQIEPEVATDAAGDYVIVWTSDGEGDNPSEYGVFAQRDNAAGVAQGSEFEVNTPTTDYAYSPDVAMDADGDFVVTWEQRRNLLRQRLCASLQRQRRGAGKPTPGLRRSEVR